MAQQSVTVGNGDSWASIAGQLTGNQRDYLQLAQQNGGLERTLHPGDVVQWDDGQAQANPTISQTDWQRTPTGYDQNGPKFGNQAPQQQPQVLGYADYLNGYKPRPGEPNVTIAHGADGTLYPAVVPEHQPAPPPSGWPAYLPYTAPNQGTRQPDWPGILNSALKSVRPFLPSGPSSSRSPIVNAIDPWGLASPINAVGNAVTDALKWPAEKVEQGLGLWNQVQASQGNSQYAQTFNDPANAEARVQAAKLYYAGAGTEQGYNYFGLNIPGTVPANGPTGARAMADATQQIHALMSQGASPDQAYSQVEKNFYAGLSPQDATRAYGMDLFGKGVLDPLNLLGPVLSGAAKFLGSLGAGAETVAEVEKATQEATKAAQVVSDAEKAAQAAPAAEGAAEAAKAVKPAPTVPEFTDLAQEVNRLDKPTKFRPPPGGGGYMAHPKGAALVYAIQDADEHILNAINAVQPKLAEAAAGSQEAAQLQQQLDYLEQLRRYVKGLKVKR